MNKSKRTAWIGICFINSFTKRFVYVTCCYDIFLNGICETSSHSNDLHSRIIVVNHKFCFYKKAGIWITELSSSVNGSEDWVDLMSRTYASQSLRTLRGVGGGRDHLGSHRFEWNVLSHTSHRMVRSGASESASSPLRRRRAIWSQAQRIITDHKWYSTLRIILYCSNRQLSNFKNF